MQFVHRWILTIRQKVFEDLATVEFLEVTIAIVLYLKPVESSILKYILLNQDLAGEVEADCIQWTCLQEEASLMHHVMSQLRRFQTDVQRHSGQRWKLPPCGQPVSLFSTSGVQDSRTIIRPEDDSKCWQYFNILKSKLLCK